MSGGSPVLFASGQSGSKYASWIPVDGRRFTLKSNGIVLASVDVHGTLPPVIAWSQVPDEGQYLLSSDTIPLRVSASDPDGSIAKVEFTLDGSIKATDSASPYLTSFSHLSAGTHTLSAVAIDKQGRSRAARIVTIHVRDSIIMGDIDGVSSDGLVTGWACSRYLPQSVKVDVYAGGPAGTGTKLGRYLANRASDASIDTSCGVASGNYRYAIQLTDAHRQKHAGQKIYIHGISPVGGGNYKLGHSGTFTVPPVPPPVVVSSTTIAYDPLGRVIAVYDSAHHLKASYQYDKNGNVTKVTDALGHATSMTYDALDRVTKVTDAEGHVTTYQYDRGGRVKAVTDPRQNTTSYTYDGFGQLWERSSPDTGTTTYSYADDGHLQGMARADGIFLTYTYDDTLGRPTSVTTGTQTRYMAYDNCTHGIGRICSVSDADSTTAYAYDPQGDITQRTFTVGSTSYALGYSYDGSGRLATLTYPDGNQASYAYQNGRLSGITATVNGSAKTVAGALTYREGDRLLTSWTAGNGLVNNYTYDGNGRLTGIAVPGVQDLSFDYDDANRIISITNGMHPSLTQGFTYDKLSRLIQVDSPSGNENYAYDANGNRTSQTVGGVTTPITVVADSNRLASVGGQAVGYDANGNVTKKGGVTLYHYDSFNRLQSAGGTTYTINPEGQRLRKSGILGTTDFAPDRSGVLLAEHATTGWVDYVYLGGHPIGSIAGSQVYAVATDQVGRPEVVTDASQAVVWQAGNKAFGREVSTEGAVLNLGFPGQYYNAESGLWHNGFRDYDANLGRYIESDPIGLAGGLNTYSYVSGNPVDQSDPSGLISTGSSSLDCKINAIVNGLAQVTPYLGAYLGFSGKSVELLNSSGPKFIQTGVNLSDVMSGLLSTAADLVKTKFADVLAKKYRGAQFRVLKNGNKAYRRGLRSANKVMWGGVKSGMRGVGNILKIVGAVYAAKGAYSDIKKCNCHGK